MSLATLNRIVREQEKFYNSKRERDKVEGPPLRQYHTWSEKELRIISENLEKPAKWFTTFINRSYHAIFFRRQLLRREAKDLQK